MNGITHIFCFSEGISNTKYTLLININIEVNNYFYIIQKLSIKPLLNKVFPISTSPISKQHIRYQNARRVEIGK